MLIVLGVGGAVHLIRELSGRRPLTTEERVFLEQYELVRSKLAHDDLVGAQTESSVLARSLRSGNAANAIVESDTLEKARLGFAALSREAISTARKRKGYYVMYCPPVGCPQKCEACPMSLFSDWVQITPAVENPFMGVGQTRCGIVRD